MVLGVVFVVVALIAFPGLRLPGSDGIFRKLGLGCGTLMGFESKALTSPVRSPGSSYNALLICLSPQAVMILPKHFLSTTLGSRAGRSFPLDTWQNRGLAPIGTMTAVEDAALGRGKPQRKVCRFTGLLIWAGLGRERLIGYPPM